MPFTSAFKALIISILLLAMPIWSAAQTGEVRGNVYDKESGELVVGAVVRIDSTKLGMVTDANGFFSIKLEPGIYKVLVRKAGYENEEQRVAINTEEKVRINFFLEAKVNKKTVTLELNDALENRKDKVEMSKIEITPEMLNYIPTVGGEADLSQYLQVIPGITFSGDQGGQFYIRGGAPIQNRVLLDGITIYNPFHSIGLFSVFDADIIKTVDVHTGGFHAGYGGRVSGIMDVTTRGGNQGKFSGNLSVSPFTSKLQVEGPLKKFDTASGGTSYMLSGRTSYLKQTSRVLYPYAAGGELPYNFTDLFGKININSVNGSTIQLFGFNFRDQVDISSNAGFNWNSSGAGGKIHLIPANSNAAIDAVIAYSNYTSRQKEPDQAERFSRIAGFQARLDITYFQNKDQLKYGIEINGFNTDFRFANAANRVVAQTDDNTELAGYMRYLMSRRKWIIDPSFRAHYYASLNELSLEPRLGVKYKINDKVRLKGAAGYYSQNLMSAQSDRDVVNLFYGFLAAPEGLPASFKDQLVESRLQKGQHLITGLEWDINSRLGFQVEAYYKVFNQITNLNREKIYDNTPEWADKPDYQRNDFIIETGNAQGIDFQMTWDAKPYYIWATYSISKTTREDGRVEYFPHWDRRHTVNLLGAYVFGSDKSWEVSLRWSYGSGFPFSKTKGYRELIDFSRDGLQTEPTIANGIVNVLYSGLNNGRLSDYHRLDFSLKKNYELKNNMKLKCTFSVTNVYDRENVFYFDRVTNLRVNQLPILPSLAVGLHF